jgi:hypothetical protein
LNNNVILTTPNVNAIIVNENWIDWDEHLSTILFSYWTTYKVGINYTPFHLVYGLHTLLPTEYLSQSRLVTTEIHKLLKP